MTSQGCLVPTIFIKARWDLLLSNQRPNQPIINGMAFFFFLVSGVITECISLVMPCYTSRYNCFFGGSGWLGWVLHGWDFHHNPTRELMWCWNDGRGYGVAAVVSTLLAAWVIKCEQKYADPFFQQGVMVVKDMLRTATCLEKAYNNTKRWQKQHSTAGHQHAFSTSASFLTYMHT